MTYVRERRNEPTSYVEVLIFDTERQLQSRR
jgi:hypothetical protein